MAATQQELSSIDKLTMGQGWSACLTYFPQLRSIKEERAGTAIITHITQPNNVITFHPFG